MKFRSPRFSGLLAFLASLSPCSYANPVAQPDSVTMHLGQKARLSVLANDTGPLDASTVAIVQPPQSGTATPDATGQILYRQTIGAPATDSFTYRVNGTGGYSAPATVSVQFSSQLRIANTPLNVPSQPPATQLQLVNAFPGVTFNQPVCIGAVPGDGNRLFVCEKGGVIKVIPDVNAVTATTAVFLNLANQLAAKTPAETLSANGEQGLLGLAFHPNYAQNRYFYVFYSVKKSDNLVYERVSRFTTKPDNADPAAPTPELILLEQMDEASNHNGGGLAFGPDGYLYISFGDEGDQNDSLNNSQRIDKDFFSAIARIDVDKKTGSLNPNLHPSVLRDAGVARYAIPSNNPFVGATSFNGSAVTASAVRTEFFAVGLRNPWRFSFDPANGELWCADVGQNAYEEIDLITSGGNYGWAYREGKHNGPKTVPTGFTSTDPIYEYTHGSGPFQGNSITGGFVYRGSRFPSLAGLYLFADYVSGNVWTLLRNGSSAPTVTRIANQAGIVAFGSDPSNGDILMANINNGTLQRLASGNVSGSSFPTTLSATGLFADLTDLSPNPGLLPYQPNVSFWSDFAVKRRWFTIPDPAGQMAWSRDGEWTFPTGQIWVKHFDLELSRSNPPIAGGTGPRKRLETRLLVKNATGLYGVSYRWNDSGTDATLVPDEGASFPVTITENGVARSQTWQVPSRGNCLTCHNPQAGYALSFNTRQLNLTNNINGFLGNQLNLLKNAGYFSNIPESPNVLPRLVRTDETNFSAEERVRSYLTANCAYCHRTGGTAPSWDGRPELKLAATGLINGTATSALHAGDKLVVPNDPASSVVYNRIAVTNGYTRMPPLASSELDASAIALVQQWINSYGATHQSYDQWRQANFGNLTSPEGAPAADPDFDRETNQEEFVARTSPLNGNDVFHPNVNIAGTQLTVSFDIPANRRALAQTSADLANWTLWDVPGNGGDLPGGVTTLSGPPSGDRQFFRVLLDER